MIDQTISLPHPGETSRREMGVVYEAQDLSLGRHVAIKDLPEEMAKSLPQGSRYASEARHNLARKVGHLES